MRKKKRGKKICDPALCANCIYVGDGGFLCDEAMEIVVEDWTPTEYYLCCEKGKDDEGN